LVVFFWAGAAFLAVALAFAALAALAFFRFATSFAFAAAESFRFGFAGGATAWVGSDSPRNARGRPSPHSCTEPKVFRTVAASPCYHQGTDSSMAKQAVETTEALRRLRLFNEKAEKLQRCSFIEKVFRPDHGVTIHFGEDQPLTVEKQGADEEATDALTLTLRFFFNQRDGISLSQMRELYEALPVPDEEKRKARDAFGRYDGFLNSGIGVVFKGHALTNWNVLETVLYGDLAHANDNKRPIFEEWREAAPFGTLVQFYYEEAVARVVQFVVACQQFNEELIGRLESVQAGPAK
jgi:hypothetical protein